MDLQELIEVILAWIKAHPLEIALGVAIFVALLMLRRIYGGLRAYFSLDRAERAFRRAGVRVPKIKIEELRNEFARAAADTERQRVAAENKQHIELSAIEAEKARILRLVRSTPAVVREAGEALKAIEREYEQSVRAMRSEQAREGLRRTTEKQIREVLRTVSDDGKNLPAFYIDEGRHEVPAPRRTAGEEN